ncbi:hypothetical protein FRC09_020306 [Ceratobasidium sp. 395]|nr:hypothetical protein FRC09_020306 [Ceratobasidium sp. 395]
MLVTSLSTRIEPDYGARYDEVFGALHGNRRIKTAPRYTLGRKMCSVHCFELLRLEATGIHALRVVP